MLEVVTTTFQRLPSKHDRDWELHPKILTMDSHVSLLCSKLISSNVNDK